MDNEENKVAIDEQELDLINKLTRRRLSSDELYTFSVILCDNEIDRDYDRFTLNALERLADLYIGKTGIFDHEPKGKNQSARIYQTEVITDGARKNGIGEPYTYVKAKAYMVRGSQSEAMILEIDGGIKKEVSVSCSVDKIKCSICQTDLKHDCCKHKKGENYSGELCHHILDGASDVYEWSFVAVPAQINAGVTKAFSQKQKYTSQIQRHDDGGEKMRSTEMIMKEFNNCTESVTLSKQEIELLIAHINDMQKSARLGEVYRNDLIGEVKRLAFLSDDGIEAEIVESVLQKMNLDELKAYKRSYQKRFSENEFDIQLKPSGNLFSMNSGASEFKV